MQHKFLIIGGIAASLLAVFAVIQFAVVKYNGTVVPAPTIPREPLAQGSGPELNYVVLGDSTAVAQGSDYQDGVAIGTAQHLAKDHQVTMTNFGVSGARAADVANEQVLKITEKPDVVMIIVGSNDVTHLTSKASVEASLQSTFKTLVDLNCEVKIVVTGSAQMGSVVRFPQPLRWIAGIRSKQLNQTFQEFSQANSLTFAELANKTGEAFRGQPQLFAPDKFHPNAKGYAIWTPVLNDALDMALATQPSHCQ